MKFCSTNDKSLRCTAREAVVQGLAPDGGLFVPVEIPVLPKALLDVLPSLTYPEIAVAVLAPYFEDDLPRSDLRQIAEYAFSFLVPLRRIDGATAVLELFHGPTCAFKDFGARFLARLLGYWTEGASREITVLVATSGDTGSAVAQGFADVPGTRVVVLYPSGKVSRVQEQQMTTLGGNITALEVRGTFDDCQSLVKRAFVDPEVAAALQLTSANSINIARLLPQVAYYFWAQSRFGDSPEPPAIIVPSGNFGNVSGALIAKRMGLELGSIIAAVNRNDTVPEFLRTGVYTPKVSVATLSNAMDVGDPNNMARLRHFFGDEAPPLARELSSRSCTDEQTLDTMARVFRDHGYLVDPHTAVGLWALGEERQARPGLPGVVLGTADPAKFSETVIRATGVVPETPAQLLACLDRPKRAIPMSLRYQEFSDFLLSLV